MLVPDFLGGGPPELSTPVASDALDPSASTSVSTARRLSVTNGMVTPDRTAAGSWFQRARTWRNREGGLVTSPAAVSGLLQALHVSSGSCVLPDRVESSSAPVASQSI